ncbi:MAG: hypothetical protein WCP17_02035 [bacterium]
MILVKNKTIQKLISGLIVLTMLTPAIFVSFQPRKADAFLFSIVIDPAHIVVTSKIVAGDIIKQVLMAVARKMLNQITQSTINWINTGNFGNPFFLENPDSFFKDIAKYEIKNIINTYGYDNLLYPFGKDFALNTINSYQRQASDNAAYTLSKVITDPVLLRSYQNDFNVGGWNGFLINTQYPQNNYLGFQMLATEELARNLQGTTQTAAQKVQKTLEQGQGFLAPQICTTNPKYNNAKNEFLQPKWSDAEYIKTHPYTDNEGVSYQDWQEAAALDKASWDVNNGCPGGLQTTTPGAVVANQIFGAMSSKTRQGELGAAMGNSLAAVFDALINKFVQKGLSALTNTGSSDEAAGGMMDTSGQQAFGTNYVNSLNNISDKYLPPPDTTNTQSGVACTGLGQDEQDFMLPLLLEGVAPRDVVNQTNAKFSAELNVTGEKGAMYLPKQNVIRLPEFYIIGNNENDPNSPAPGEWTISSQCSDTVVIPTSSNSGSGSTSPASLPSSGGATIPSGGTCGETGMPACGGTGPINNAPVTEVTPGWGGDLAYNESANNWLVVSKDASGTAHDGIITGRIMSNSNTPAGGQFDISHTNPTLRGGNPRISFSPSLNKYLVVWGIDFGAPQYGGQIFGRFVTADGQMSGQPFQISGQIGQANISSKIEYDSNLKKFVVAIDGFEGGTYLVTIGEDGKVDAPLKVSPYVGHNFSSNVSINPTLGEYCVFYTNQRSTAEYSQLFVKKYDANTKTLGKEYTVSSRTDSHFGGGPSVAYNKDDGQYLAVWSYRSTKAGVGRYLKNCAPTGSEFVIKQNFAANSVSYNPISKLFGVIGGITVPAPNSGKNGEENYYLFIDSLEKIIAGARIFTNFNATGNIGPIIRANTKDGSFAATSSRDFGVTRMVTNITE